MEKNDTHFTLDEIYRGYRIAVTAGHRCAARISSPRGPVVPIVAEATLQEGPETCLRRARDLVDRYIDYLSGRAVDAD